MAGQIHRIIKGRDAQHRANRRPASKTLSIFTGRRPVNAEHFAAQPPRLFSRDQNGLQRAAGLADSGLAILAAFQDHRFDDLIKTLLHQPPHILQNFGTPIAWQPARDFKTSRRPRHRIFHIIRRRHRNRADNAAIIGELDFQNILTAAPFAADKVLLGHELSFPNKIRRPMYYPNESLSSGRFWQSPPICLKSLDKRNPLMYNFYI